MPSPFDPWLARWSLTPDGAARRTHSSDLLPVRWLGESGQRQAAMLKLARSDEERRGAGLMAFWQGDGAARVLAVSKDGAALLLERVSGPRSLTALVHAGHDDEATRLLCAVAARLHRPRSGTLPPLLPLSDTDSASFLHSRAYTVGKAPPVHPYRGITSGAAANECSTEAQTMLWGTFCSALWKAVGSEIYPARGDIHAMTRAGLEGGDRSRALHGIFSFPLPRTSPHPR
ncbi:aminoglycoside phosphotransferase family protein [Deinococcus wulumuqiensis]